MSEDTTQFAFDKIEGCWYKDFIDLDFKLLLKGFLLVLESYTVDFIQKCKNRFFSLRILVLSLRYFNRSPLLLFSLRFFSNHSLYWFFWRLWRRFFAFFFWLRWLFFNRGFCLGLRLRFFDFWNGWLLLEHGLLGLRFFWLLFDSHPHWVLRHHAALESRKSHSVYFQFFDLWIPLALICHRKILPK